MTLEAKERILMYTVGGIVKAVRITEKPSALWELDIEKSGATVTLSFDPINVRIEASQVWADRL
jgi:hypothetical protein